MINRISSQIYRLQFLFPKALASLPSLLSREQQSPVLREEQQSCSLYEETDTKQSTGGKEGAREIGKDRRGI